MEKGLVGSRLRIMEHKRDFVWKRRRREESSPLLKQTFIEPRPSAANYNLSLHTKRRKASFRRTNFRAHWPLLKETKTLLPPPPKDTYKRESTTDDRLRRLRRRKVRHLDTDNDEVGGGGPYSTRLSSHPMMLCCTK